MTAVTVTRYVGHCQICEGLYKLDAGCALVHHGYKRPGWGSIVGDCGGVGAPAYEQSRELLKRYTAKLRQHLADDQEFLHRLQRGQVTELSVMVWSSSSRTRDGQEPRTYKLGDPEFPRVLERKIADKERDIKYLASDISRCQARIDAWTRQPVQTVQEVEANDRATREAASAARDAKRAGKLAAKVAGYQKRIDSAVRRGNTNTLRDIFETAPGKLREIAGRTGLTRPQALALLERTAVWESYGLDVQNLDSDANDLILRKMWRD